MSRTGAGDLALRFQIGHTSDLDAHELERIRALLDVAFDGDFDEADWAHTLGGLHVLAWAGDALVGHSSVVQRSLCIGDRSLRTGYVEGIGVRSDLRHRGIGSDLLTRIERIIRSAYDIGALGATDGAATMYTRRGWLQWRGRLSALTPAGIVATPDDCGCVYVLVVDEQIDRDSELTCDWRNGDLW